MRSVSLTLSSNGDSFECSFYELPLPDVTIRPLKVDEHIHKDSCDLYKEGDQLFAAYCIYRRGHLTNETVNYPISASKVPEFIDKALSCRNRKDVEQYIQDYLLGAKSKNLGPMPYKEEPIENEDWVEYSIEDEVGTLYTFYLSHACFNEQEPGLDNHYHNGYHSHRETPEEMLQFLRKRSTFFEKNYNEGKQYKNTSWRDLSWLAAFLNYYLLSIKNTIANSGLGWLLGINGTHYCEDFEQGLSMETTL